jgi:ABC-type transport system substrate-binding protein
MNIRFILSRFLGVMLLLLFAMSAAFSAPAGKITIAMPFEPATLDPAKSNTRYNHTFSLFSCRLT